MRKKSERSKEQEMLRSFHEQVKKILSDPNFYKKKGDEIKIGFESEIGIYRDDLKLNEIEQIRDKILEKVPDITDKELGVTPNIDEILQWVSYVRKILKEVFPKEKEK